MASYVCNRKVRCASFHSYRKLREKDRTGKVSMLLLLATSFVLPYEPADSRILGGYPMREWANNPYEMLLCMIEPYDPALL